MRLENLQMLYLVATLLIVSGLSLTAKSSCCAMAAAVVATEMDANGLAHINKPSMMTENFNRLPRHTVESLHQHKQEQQPQRSQQEHQQKIEDPSSLEDSKVKRSFFTNGGWAPTTYNGLGGGHIGSSKLYTIRSGSSDAIQQPTNQVYPQYTEAKPIYEKQQENDYSEESVGGGPLYSQHSSTGFANAPAFHSALYNLQTAGMHNAAVGTSGSDSSTSNGGSNGFLPPWNFGKLSTSFISSQAVPSHYSSSSGSRSATSSNNDDKISEGNFLHHYDSASAFNEYTSQHEFQQQLQELQKHESVHNSVEHTEADTSSLYDDEQEHESNNNYHASALAGHYASHQQSEEKQPDVINYVPYPVVKKQHVPVREPVQIPVSHAVIIPVSKPVPIHIPVSKNVQVPVEHELKIPVERVVPYPVEKHVPVPVEKRVPYPVVKYVPVKIPRPFPVKVPVFKTVLHKIKGWW